MHGAEPAATLHKGVSHVICLVDDDAPFIAPATLLEAASKQAGGPAAVAALRQGLEEGRMQLVTAG